MHKSKPFRIHNLVFALIFILTIFSISISAKEKLPECEDGGVRMIKKVIDGKPFYALEPRLSGEFGYGILISSHKVEVVKDKKGRKKEKLVPLVQSEFDTLLSQAKNYRSQKAALKKQAQWSGIVTFVRTEHFDLEWDIPGMNIYKEGNKNQVECMLIYAQRCEDMWKDAEKVFGPMENSDLNGPIKPCIHDTSSNTIKTAKNLLGMTLNLGPVRGTYSYIGIWYNKTSITDDQDLWETVTHNVAGVMACQYRGLGRNQGSIPAWLDEGFAYYLTRIHRHLDKHTTKLFAESAEFGPKQIDGSSWKNVAKKEANKYDNKQMRKVMDKALSSLTQEECILGWSIVSYLIENNIAKYKKLLKKLDDDDNRYVSEDEFFQDKLRFDKNGDLELSSEEKAEGFALFRSYDLNKDGKIHVVEEAVAHDFRKFLELQKQSSEKAATTEEALQKSYGWTLGELFDRWRAWLDGRRYETADMPDLSEKSWNKFKKNLKKALQIDDPVKKARAIMNLARFDSTDAAYVLYLALAEIEKLVKKNEERPLIIYTAAQKVVSLWKGNGLKAVLQMAQEGKCGGKKADDVAVRSYLLQGVAGCPGHERINVLLAKLTKSEEIEIRTAACDVLGLRGVAKGADKYWKDVLKCLKDEVRSVRIAAVQALAKLANRNNSDQFIKIVEELVNLLYNADGVIKDYLYKALIEVTGEDLGPSYHGYMRWVQIYKKALKEGNENPQPNVGNRGEGEHKTDEVPPTYLGEKIFSKQIVFVIDRSFSMMEPIKNLKELRREITKGRKKSERTGGDDDDDEEEEGGIDWSKVKVKWDLARETLLQTVRSLKDKHKFTVILFDHRVWIWSTQMVPATDDNKKKIEHFLVNQPPANSQGQAHWGRTNIFDALAIAFEITTGEKITSRKGKKPAKTGAVDAEIIEKGAELINLLTDGAPTDGKYRNTEDILMRIIELNRTRKVKINTFGIGKGHNAELLQELAEQNNGFYKDLTRAGG